MKRRGLVQIVLILLFAIGISACDIQKDVNIKSIAVVEDTVPAFVVAGEFDKAGIKALITYEDGSKEFVDINSKLLGDVHQEKISKPGEYEIEILFRGQNLKFKVKVVDGEGAHVVKFFNGFNELISMQLVKDGEAAKEPSLESHQMNGYKFVGWDRKFDNVKMDIVVYGIYAKIDGAEDDSMEVSYQKELFNALTKMREVDVNVLEIWDIVSKKFEKTLSYDNQELKQIVKKEINADQSVAFHKYSKELNESALIKYVYEKYSADGFYSKVDITVDEFDQYDLYARVKKIVTSTDMLTYSLMKTEEGNIFKLEAIIPNNGDGNYESETIEILFNGSQVLSIKRYLNYPNTVGMVDKVLSVSEYFKVSPEELIVFPKDLDLGEIVSSVFRDDVVIDIYELRDELTHAKTIKNDAQKLAAIVYEGSKASYIWDKDEATYYTKEVQEAGESFIRVYKTIASENRYGNMFYYEWKNLANYQPTINVDEFGRVEIMFRIGETSSSRAHNVVFVIEDGKLVEFEKHYYVDNEKVVFERVKLEYKDVEVTVPEQYINSEPNAILE